MSWKTQKGYLVVTVNGRRFFEHVHVWQTHNGRTVPEGHDIHHINHVKDDNRIENLQLVTKLEHKRIHGGCELIGGVWWKPCHICGGVKPITAEHWWLGADGRPLYGRCRRCRNRYVASQTQRRRDARRKLGIFRSGKND